MKAVLFKLKLWLNSLLMYLVCYFTKDIKFLKISIFKTLLISDLLFDNSEHKIYQTWIKFCQCHRKGNQITIPHEINIIKPSNYEDRVVRD